MTNTNVNPNSHQPQNNVVIEAPQQVMGTIIINTVISVVVVVAVYFLLF